MRKLSSIIGVCLLVSCASTQNPTNENSEQIVYVGELKSFLFEDSDNVYELPGSDEIIVSNSCGKMTAKLHVLASTRKIKTVQTVHREIGEWCTTPFDWHPVRDYLVIANYPSMEIVGTFPVDFETAIVRYDLQEDEDFTVDTKKLLQVELLNAPFPYPYKVNLGIPERLEEYRQNDFLDVRDNEVVVVKGINLTKIFGDDR